jgi:hypothetical protein
MEPHDPLYFEADPLEPFALADLQAEALPPLAASQHRTDPSDRLVVPANCGRRWA